MNEDLKERHMQRRRRANLNTDENSETITATIAKEENEVKTNRRQRRGVLGTINDIKANRDVDKDDTNNENSESATNPIGSQIQSAIIDKHKQTSKEIEQKIVEKDPNEVVEEMHVVREKIKDKIKQGFESELEKAKQEMGSREENLKLDLTLSTNERGFGPSRLSTDHSTIRDSSQQRRLKPIINEKSNYRVIGGSKRETTRFDDNNEESVTEDQEEEEEEVKEERTEKIDEESAKRKFKEITEEIIQKEITPPNREDQYEFFTNDKFARDEFDDPVEKKKKTQTKVIPELIREASKVDENNERTVLLIETDDLTEVSFNRAEYLGHEKRKNLEKNFIFMPSGKKVALSKKLGNNMEKPRYLEDEGYYVGQKPYMTKNNKNLMANRLLKLPDNSGIKWFDVDGELIALPDPIKYVSTRPSFNPALDTSLEAEYKKSMYVHDFANNLLAEKGSLGANTGSKYRIDVDINSAVFTCHNLLSNEHLTANKLDNMVRNFKSSEEQNLIEILSAKLKALKEAETRFKAELDQQANNRGILKSQLDKDKLVVQMGDLNKLMAYRNEIKHARQQRDNEMRLKKDLTEKILLTWKELKDVRNKQKFRNTDIKLVIKKKETNKQREVDEFEKDLKDEFDEIIEEKSEELHKETAIYNQKLKAYKFQQTRKTEAKKRQEEREKKEKPVNFNIKKAAELKEEEERDKKILSEEDLPKPTKPADLDKDAILKNLRTTYDRVRKVPGEPLLYFDVLEEPGTITNTNQCSASEQSRRNKLAKTRVYVKIFFNGKLVFTTSESQLQNDFTLRWGQIFNIFMMTYPESILLQLFEFHESKSNERMIAEINLPTPEIYNTSTNYSLENYEFASAHAFYKLKASNQVEPMYTSGVLRGCACWGVDERDGVTVLAPEFFKKHTESQDIRNNDAIAALGVSRMQDIEKLAKWIMKSNLDPNDPRNTDLIELIKNITDSEESGSAFGGLKLPEHFRLDQMMHEFNFCMDEDIDKNRRFRLIALRAQDEPEFKGFKMLPNEERYVRKDMFEQYEKRKLKDFAGGGDDDEDEDGDSSRLDSSRKSKVKEPKNEIDEARIAGQKHIRRIREQILSQFKFIQSQKSLSDMIIEEQVPNINALGSLFYNLYVEPKRPLYPTRRERKKITGQNLTSDDVKILVNVINAYDLPIRKDKLTNDPMKVIKDPVTGRSIKIHEHIAGESLVRPFVEVTFQNMAYRTATADGPNASWNHEIHLAFNAPNNDLRPESLQTCKDILFFNIYDEVEMDALEDERDRNHVVHKKILRYWLGSLKIPFSTLYFKSKIEGTFKMDSPPLMLGYTRDQRLSKLHALKETVINMESPIKESSYLTLFITIEPQLLIPDIFRESYDSIESQELLGEAVKWAANFSKKFPEREFRPTVMDTSGKSVIVTRYFTPIKPPSELIENGESSYETTQNVARFVSLIPFVSDSLVFPGLSDVWSTCEEFLEILAGDEEEHSVLLVNYFLGLGKKAWLLIGSSITEGIGAYPLSDEKDGFTIWYQGQPYKVNEPHNPVKVVSALVNSENIWVNIQSFDEPYRINFDLADVKSWEPFFNRSNLNKLITIQKSELTYFKTEPKYAKELESKIERKLNEKLQEWRPRHLTKYNRYACSALRQILIDMEKLRNQTVQSEPDELKQLENSYRISGFPINLPYTNMNAIFEAVQATQVHAMPSSEIEYALAVHIHPYPNTILSVWVYLAVLSRK